MYSLPPKVRLFDDISSENSKWGIVPSKRVCSFVLSVRSLSKHVLSILLNGNGVDFGVPVFDHSFLQ